jgi:hypothetical protein
MDTADKDKIPGEAVTIHQYIQLRKRRKARAVTIVMDEHGSQTKDQEDIMRSFTDHMTRKYENIPIDEGCIQRKVSFGLKTVPMSANDTLEEPVTMDELLDEVRKGKAYKSPGRNGTCSEFLKATWEVTKQDMLDVINHMHMEGAVTEA